MILLDTHVWVWWVHGDSLLPDSLAAAIELSIDRGLAISAISCWEVAKLVERNRLELPMQLNEWMGFALGGSGIALINLSPEICVESTRLENFHRDPADQIIVATARLGGFRLATCDSRIRAHPSVSLLDDEIIHDGP